MDVDEFDSALAPARYDPSTRVVIAEDRSLGREWRLVVAEGQIITGGQYLDRGRIVVGTACPTEVFDFARDVFAAVAWAPDELFLADVCESEGSLYLLELNGFSTSAIYPCDYASVVATTSRLALRRWGCS